MKLVWSVILCSLTPSWVLAQGKSNVQDVFIYDSAIKDTSAEGYEYFYPEVGEKPLADQFAERSDIVLSRSGGSGKQTSLFFRGGNSEHSLILLNGLPLYEASHPSGGFNWALLDHVDAEVIEVYTGPESFIYSSEAMSGVINIITPRKSKSSHLKLLAESYGRRGINWKQKDNGETWFKTFTLDVDQADGPSQADEESGNREWDATSKAHVSFSALKMFSLNEQLYLYTSSTIIQNDLDAHGGLGGDDPNSTEHTGHLTAQLHFQRYIPNSAQQTEWSLVYLQDDRENNNDPDGGNSQDLKGDYSSSTLGITNKTLIEGGWVNTWLGWDYFQDQAVTEFKLDTSSFDLPQQQIGRGGVFAVLKWSNFSLGSRYNYHEIYYGQWDTKASFWTQWKGIKSWFTFGTASHNPSLYQLFDPQYGNTQLKPEKSLLTELGSSFSRGNWHFKMIFYDYHITDLISANSNSRADNISESSIQGVDTKVTYEAHPLDHTFSHTYLHAENLKTKNLLLKRPHNKITYQLGYQINERLKAEYKVLYMDARKDYDDSNFNVVDLAEFNEHSLALKYDPSENHKFSLQLFNLANRQNEWTKGYELGGRRLFFKYSLLY